MRDWRDYGAGPSLRSVLRRMGDGLGTSAMAGVQTQFVEPVLRGRHWGVLWRHVGVSLFDRVRSPYSQAAIDTAVARSTAGQVVIGSTIEASAERAAVQAGVAAVRKQLIRRVALRVAVVLVAGVSSPVVGTVVTVAAAAYTIYAGARYIQERLRETANGKKRGRDAMVQVADQNVPNPNYNPRTDKYRQKESCKPWESVATQASTSVWANGNSKVLKTNLKDAGCECPDGTQAHHIGAKRAGYAAGDRLRQCLQNGGIKVDWAGNGICLPTNDEDPEIVGGRTKIASHQNSGLHSVYFIEDLANQCEAASNGLSGAAREQAVRDFLDRVRTSIHNYRSWL